jgi:hypothetical protein
MFSYESQGEIIKLTIDREKSFFNLSAALFDGLSFQSGEPQNIKGDRAPLHGHIYLEKKGDEIRILPDTEILLFNNGIGLPGRFNGAEDSRVFNETPSEAAFAFTFEKPFPLSISMRDLVFSLFDEDTKKVINDEFDPSGTTVVIERGLADLTLGLPPQSDLSNYMPTLIDTSNVGRFESTAEETNLYLPINFVFQEPGALTVKANYEGEIIAYLEKETFSLKQPLALKGMMDSTSRFYDYFSDAYAEIGLDPDGFYQINNPDRQYGSYDVFINQELIDIGKFTVESGKVSGKGLETAKIIDWFFDITQTVDTTRGATTTEVSNTDGTITFIDGQPVNVNLVADLDFEFQSGLVKGFNFPGNMTITNNYFELQADNTHSTILGAFRNKWDLKGDLSLPGLPALSPKLKLSINYDTNDKKITISWPTQPGLSYSLQTKSNLAENTWQIAHATVIAESEIISIDLPFNSNNRFYTVTVK